MSGAYHSIFRICSTSPFMHSVLVLNQDHVFVLDLFCEERLVAELSTSTMEQNANWQLATV